MMKIVIFIGVDKKSAREVSNNDYDKTLRVRACVRVRTCMSMCVPDCRVWSTKIIWSNYVRANVVLWKLCVRLALF